MPLDRKAYLAAYYQAHKAQRAAYYQAHKADRNLPRAEILARIEQKYGKGES
jgi:diketogulonate reductase-like aldo/keto reductase